MVHQTYRVFRVIDGLYEPLCMTSGLFIGPSISTKAMHSVVAYLHARGHWLFSYLDYFFGAAATVRSDHPSTMDDTRKPERDIRLLFERLGLAIPPEKSGRLHWMHRQIETLEQQQNVPL